MGRGAGTTKTQDRRRVLVAESKVKILFYQVEHPTKTRTTRPTRKTAPTNYYLPIDFYFDWTQVFFCTGRNSTDSTHECIVTNVDNNTITGTRGTQSTKKQQIVGFNYGFVNQFGSFFNLVRFTRKSLCCVINNLI